MVWPFGSKVDVKVEKGTDAECATKVTQTEPIKTTIGGKPGQDAKLHTEVCLDPSKAEVTSVTLRVAPDQNRLAMATNAGGISGSQTVLTSNEDMVKALTGQEELLSALKKISPKLKMSEPSVADPNIPNDDFVASIPSKGQKNNVAMAAAVR
jgi:hypothetical protein